MSLAVTFKCCAGSATKKVCHRKKTFATKKRYLFLPPKRSLPSKKTPSHQKSSCSQKNKTRSPRKETLSTKKTLSLKAAWTLGKNSDALTHNAGSRSCRTAQSFLFLRKPFLG